LQLRLEKDIDVAIGHFDFGVGVVLPRPRRAAPAALPDALLNVALAAGSSSDEPGRPPLSKTLENAMILEDWKLLAANLTCTSQWLNLVATPRDLLAWIGGDARDGPAVQPSHDFVDYRSWEEQTHTHSTRSATQCARTHTHRVRALTRTRAHTCTQARARRNPHVHTQMRMHALTETITRARAHTCAHARANARTRSATQVGHPDGYNMRYIFKEPVACNIARFHHLRGCGRGIFFGLCAAHALAPALHGRAHAAMQWHCAAGSVGSQARRIGGRRIRAQGSG
jgi:hypothetical protein